MNLLHPASAGAVITLWFMNGVPVRLVHGTTRYRVITAEQRTDDAGWQITARGPSGQASSFAVRPLGEGWELSSAN